MTPESGVPAGPARLVGGRGLLESPRWVGGRLWFADWIAGEVLALDVGSGAVTVVARHASLPLCFDVLPDGTPVLVSNPERALLRLGADGELSRYADLSALTPLGFNDIVVDGQGNAYVNGAGYDPRTGAAPAGDEAPGFVALVAPDGASRVVARDLAFPNGMAITADGGTLLVAESHRGRLTAFAVAADGSLGARRTFADLGAGAPDGICIDRDGAAWYADVPHRRCVRVADGGEVLGTVELDRGAFACALGGADGRTLFVVAAHWHGMQALGPDVHWDGSVYAVPAPAAGAGRPARG